MNTTKQFNRMRELRSTPVKDLTPDQCRKLQYHHHGGPVPVMRRKAYLLKGNPDGYYFEPSEAAIIQRAIDGGI